MVKPGSSYWVGPFTDAQDDDEGYWLLKGGDRDEHPIPLGVPAIVVHESEVIPDSPALPKVAAWLVETEDAVDVITIGLNSIEAINEYEYDGECGFVLTDMNKIRDRNAIAALRALVAALTPEAGDAGAGT